MICSYLLSSTLVPVFSTWLMREAHRGEGSFLRGLYERYLRVALRFRWPLGLAYAAACAAVLWVVLPGTATELFPDANAPLLRLRLRAPAGTRIEETERMTLRAIDAIRREAGPENVTITSDFVGVVPSSYPVNLIHLFTSGPQEAVVQVALRPEAPRGEPLRERIRKAVTEMQLSFEAADIVSQVMSFGSPTPIEVAVQGVSLADDYAHARKVRARLAKLDFLRDVQFVQEASFPTLDIAVDRERAGQFGLTMADVVRSVVPATSSSRFTDPNYWRDPNSGNAFQIQVQIPQNRMQGVEEVASIPVTRNGQAQLSDIATMTAGTMPGLIERHNGQRVVSLTANIYGVTLGEAAAQIRRAIAEAGAPPRGVSVRLRGQIPPLEETLAGLRVGLLLAVAAIFLLLAANFQSVRLALAVLLTIPAVLCGVLLTLRLTGTTLNIQSFMGAIMAIGIAVANSILLVTFAERARREGLAVMEATHEGASSRLRAVLMTAAAMISGMLPMALGEPQSAPLGRAVIGGLALSTVATLGVLPAIYAILQGRARVRSVSLNPSDPESRYYEA
jgi:multidrug efflux pump subunit AcrB